MCREAGIGWHITNHSLRATAATQMFRQSAPKKVIQEQTGHRSIEALRSYERHDEIQHKAVSYLLSNVPGNSRFMAYNQHLMSIKNHNVHYILCSYTYPINKSSRSTWMHHELQLCSSYNSISTSGCARYKSNLHWS